MTTQSPTSTTRETALITIENLRKKYGSHGERLADANEAKTRLLLVDTILLALGWARDDFCPEEPAGHVGYCDYLLKTSGMPRLVVEAKRAGHTFGPPRSQARKTLYALRYVRSAFGPPFTEVLEQAEKYTQECGVPFAVITNGAEWVLAQVIPTPSQDINDLRCFMFGNLLGDSADFEAFWELLSRHAVEQGHLEEHFAQLNSFEVEYCAVPRNRLEDFPFAPPDEPAYLRDFYNCFFDEIVDPGRRKMLEHCFVTNTRLDQYEGELKRALRDTAPAFLQEATDITPADRKQVLPADSGDQKGPVILVTGSVGCGKSTFANKILVEARQTASPTCLLIDLIDEVTRDLSEVDALVGSAIRREWKAAKPESHTHDVLRRIFGRELQDLRNGPRSRIYDKNPGEFDRAEAELLDGLLIRDDAFTAACWRYYRQKGEGIAVFIDNVDRASEDYQRRVYAYAHRLARDTGATVVLTMRETTLFRGRESGFLDVRSNDTVLHLQSPDLVQLLSKRIRYVQDHIDQDHRASKWKRQPDWLAFRQACQDHAVLLKRAFLDSAEGVDALQIVAAVAWHDVRYFLQFLRHLHLLLGGAKPWTKSDVIAGLLAPNNLGGPVQILPNPYRSPYPRYPCHFLKIRIILMLLYGRQVHESRRGYPLSAILQFARIYGYHEKWTRTAVEEMVRERLLECLETPAAAEFTKDYLLGIGHTFRPSPLAVVFVEKIQADPVFLAISGNELQFHTQSSFAQYLGIVLETMRTSRPEERLLGRLVADGAADVVGAYLSWAFRAEQAVGSVVSFVPEASVAETRLADFLSPWTTTQSPEPDGKPHPGEQLSLLSTNGSFVLRLPDLVPVPRGITDKMIGQSSFAPLIFWALVAFRASGKRQCTGTQIAAAINEYLVDDLRKKEATNVSRALRQATLQSQPWLATQKIRGVRRRMYSLTDSWRAYWMQLFGEPVPAVE